MNFKNANDQVTHWLYQAPMTLFILTYGTDYQAPF